MDYGIAIDRLMPGADYGQDKTYELLAKTWRDVRPVPSDADLQAAFAAWEAEQQTTSSQLAADRAQLAADIGKLGTPYRSVLQRIARGAGLID